MALKQAAVAVLGSLRQSHQSSEALLNGALMTVVRTKVFTSNVMDENRSKRISEHCNYQRSLRGWKCQMHRQILLWRAEQKQKEQIQHDLDESQRQLALAKERQDQAIHDKKVRLLEEDLKKAQLEVEVVSASCAWRGAWCLCMVLWQHVQCVFEVHE